MPVRARPSLLDVLALEEVDRDLHRSILLYPDEGALYGGQVAAQALLAAARTVPGDRLPHSLHLYFLRSGTAARPVDYRVRRDRDGRAFNARRVDVIQDGRLLATVACSFAVEASGVDVQTTVVPAAPEDPGDLPPYPSRRLFGFECRRPADQVSAEWPTRFWSRCVDPLPDDRLLHAAALTYLSDRSSGLGGLDVANRLVPVSLDHALWLHRPTRVDEWVLVQLVPHTLAAERTWYTGTLHNLSGVLAASLTQEVLSRPARPTEVEGARS